MKNKLIGLLGLAVALTACDVDNELGAIAPETTPTIALTEGSADFSKFVSIGASFASGFSDGALFVAGQENSYPNIMASKFAMAGGGDFAQPLMADNIGGMLFGGTQIQNPRYYFDGAGPAPLDATPTTEGTTVLSGPFNNMGVPGMKSLHLGVAGYGNLAGVPVGMANPYYARMASSGSASVLQDVLVQAPTFFSLSEIGGNDVLSFAISGGTGVDQTGNFDPTTYGGSDITDPNVFAAIFSGTVDALTAGGAKGVVANLPNITHLPYFTTVPHNPVPLDQGTADMLNSDAAFGAYNSGVQQAFGAAAFFGMISAEVAAAQIAQRTITFAAGADNALVIVDETLINLHEFSAAFPVIPQYRQATANDLIVLPAATFIGTTVGGDPTLINGVSVPLEDQWVLIPSEQASIATATASYNATIEGVAAAKGLAMVDLDGVMEQAANGGIAFDDFNMTTSLVFGGAVSLDGIHLTGRGYALMANKMLAAIDAAYGSNFSEATGGLAKAYDYPTHYSPTMQ